MYSASPAPFFGMQCPNNPIGACAPKRPDTVIHAPPRAFLALCCFLAWTLPSLNAEMIETPEIPRALQGRWVLHVLSDDGGKTLQNAAAGGEVVMHVGPRTARSPDAKFDQANILRVLVDKDDPCDTGIFFTNGKVWVTTHENNDNPNSLIKVTIWSDKTLSKELSRWVITVSQP
jgi:hypothetical protein